MRTKEITIYLIILLIGLLSIYLLKVYAALRTERIIKNCSEGAIEQAQKWEPENTLEYTSIYEMGYNVCTRSKGINDN